MCVIITSSIEFNYVYGIHVGRSRQASGIVCYYMSQRVDYMRNVDENIRPNVEIEFDDTLVVDLEFKLACSLDVACCERMLNKFSFRK